MNRLPGNIRNITSEGRLSLLEVEVNGQLLSTVVIETPDNNPWLATGRPVWMVFKETEVALSKNLSGGLSIINRLRCRVDKIEKGAILASVRLCFGDSSLTAVIPARLVGEMVLQPGEEVELLIRANEIMLMNRSDDEK